MVLFVLLLIAVFLRLAAVYTRSHPLDLTRELPKVAQYVMPEGVKLEADKVELFFDNGPVLRVSGLGVRGADGNLGIFVEQAAIKLASSQLFLLSAAPKVIEASGVTLRVVRAEDGISIAGLDLGQGHSNKGVVEWLNGLKWDRVWMRVRTVRVADVNLLVRDDVQHAEWVLERGNLVLGRSPDAGEHGTLTAVLRRLYGTAEKLGELDNVPILISFAHEKGAQALVIRGRLDRADAQMVTDYFPPQFKDLLQAQGQVEVGTQVMAKNKVEQPWVTLRLTDVKVQPPEGFSKALIFPKMTVTASYVPPVVGVSDSDVLTIRDLQAVTTGGSTVSVSGTISSVQSDPLINLNMVSPKGEVQGLFDLFPDQAHGFAKALNWLRPNIQGGDYANLRAHYLGKPSAFPGCGDHCGVLDIDADVTNGVVRFLSEITPLKVPEAELSWRGQTLTVTAPQGTVGGQVAGGLRVDMTNIFSPSPTDIHVTGTLKGEAGEVLAEIGKIEETNGKVPQGITGQHVSMLDILVPMPRGQEATFATSVVQVSSSISNINVHGLPELKGLDFAGQKATVSLDAAKTLRVVSDGLLGGNVMKVDWSQNIQPKIPGQMKLVAVGTVTGEWLMAQAPSQLVSMTGPVGVSLNLQEDKVGKWLFAAKADGGKAAVRVDDAHYKKARNSRLAINAAGSYVPSGTVVLDTLDVQGDGLTLNGTVNWKPNDIAGSTVKLPVVKVGDTNVSVDFANGLANVSGTRLDLRGVDVFGGNVSGSEVVSGTVPSTQPDNLQVNATLGEILFAKGRLTNVAAAVHATKGHWEVQKLAALVDGKSRIAMQMNPLKNQPGRKKLTIDVQDLGHTLTTLGVYDQLGGGHMSGEITYDAPQVGGGLIKIDHFELKNPPVLVQLLSLLSLEQLLAGTTSTLFKTATVPVRVDNGTWFIDNANFVGPSMSLRLDGSYDTDAKELNFDGKMAPGIPLNRLVGKIPLLGRLLTGSQDGLVVADFKLKGSTADPQINVRPLSVITPGLLKDAWRGLTGPDDDKPKPKVIDGRSK